jgi:phosphoribosylaminoimidazole-succinocarboxamide synthase
MLVRKCEVLKVEAIVRGYLTGKASLIVFCQYSLLRNEAGSGYAEYQKSGTVHGIKLPPGLPESARLEEPLFTPSTKADIGSHDENIHPDQRAFGDGTWSFYLSC